MRKRYYIFFVTRDAEGEVRKIPIPLHYLYVFLAGAVIGNNRGHHSAKRGATVGVLAGGAAGAIVGAMMDKQERELRQIQGVNVTRTAPDELNVTVRNEVLFDFNSSSLRGASRDSLREMANVFEKYPNTTIEVAGHTDSIGC